MHYILVNSDGLKLPVGGRLEGSCLPSSIPIKFVQNPIKVETEDDLFDLLDKNRRSPVKYFFMMNDPKKQLNVQQMLYRKFFYENSVHFDEEIIFAEVTNKNLAVEALGLTSEEEILVVMNQNTLSNFGSDFKTRTHKFLNLPLTMVGYKDAGSTMLQSKYL